MTGTVLRDDQLDSDARGSVRMKAIADLRRFELDPLEMLRREMDLWPSEEPEVRAPMSDGERAVFEIVWREDSTMDEESDDVDVK